MTSIAYSAEHVHWGRSSLTSNRSWMYIPSMTYITKPNIFKGMWNHLILILICIYLTFNIKKKYICVCINIKLNKYNDICIVMLSIHCISGFNPSENAWSNYIYDIHSHTFNFNFKSMRIVLIDCGYVLLNARNAREHHLFCFNQQQEWDNVASIANVKWNMFYICIKIVLH